VGKAGSGKTTAARLLVEKYGFLQRGFATKLKEFAEAILLRDLEKPRDRRFLQLLGDGARLSDPLVWINWLSWYFFPTFEGYDLVIDDCRYLNEGKYLKKHGFWLIRMEGRGYNMAPENMDHVSEMEQEQIECDFELDSSGSVDECYSRLELILGVIRKT